MAVTTPRAIRREGRPEVPVRQRQDTSCCQPHHDGTAPAEAVTPEAIVRARFSAYVKNVPKYIVASTHPDSKDMNARTTRRSEAAREGCRRDHEEVNFTSLPREGDQGGRRGDVRDVRGVLQGCGEEEQGWDQDPGGEVEVQEG